MGIGNLQSMIIGKLYESLRKIICRGCRLAIGEGLVFNMKSAAFCIWFFLLMLLFFFISPSAHAQEAGQGKSSQVVNVARVSTAASGKVSLTPEERQWLSRHYGRIRIGITVIPPEVLNENGRFQGLAIDYIHLMEQRLGCRFELVPYTTWNEVIQAARMRRIDMIFAAQQTPERLNYLLFTEPYIELPNIILVRKDRQGGSNLKEMKGWSIAVSEGSAVHEYLEKNFGYLELRPVQDELSGLMKVSIGEVDAMVVEISRASYYIEQAGISNLRVAGDADFIYKLRFAIRNDWPVLRGILDKGLSSITDKEKQDITQRWVIIENRGIFASRVFWISFCAGLVLIMLTVAGVVVWNLALRRKVRQRTSQLQQELAQRRRTEVSLRESEEKFRTIADHILNWEYWTAQDGSLVYVSPSCESITSYKAEEFYQDPELLIKIIHPDDIENYLQHLNDIAKDTARGDCQVRDFRILTRNGEERWIAHICREVFNRDGESMGRRVSNRAITERKVAEEALRKSEAHYRSIFANSLIGVTVTDRNFIFTDANEAFCRMLEYSREELIGKMTISDVSHPDDVMKSMDMIDKLIRHEIDHYTLEKRYVSKTGNILPALVYVRGHYNLAGEYEGTTASNLDITEQKRTEELLRENEEKYRSLFNNSEIAMFRSRLDGSETLEVNQKFLDIVGKTREEVQGKPSVMLWEDPTERGEMIRRLVRDGSISDFEFKLFNTRKGVRNCLTSLRLYREQGILEGSVADITERKKVEEERVKLQDQLIQSQKMESIGQLAGGVAHDFNNMLGVILGHAEMAMDQVDPGETLYADIEEIRKAAQRSAEITRQLLTFARKQAIAPKVLDLNETVEGSLKMLQRLLGENIDLIWIPGSELWEVKADPVQIGQILTNLCVNARDAIAEVGEITVETGNSIFDNEYCSAHPGSVAGDYVRMSVRDTGSGMNDLMLAHIFEPFFTTKDVGQGTGLGLSMVYGAVKQNNGFIDVSSEPGQGTTFTAYFPRYGAEDTLATEKSARRGVEAPVGTGNETILLVEDEPKILKMTKMMLQHLGYAVLTAGTPGEAIRLAEEHTGKIHLLITDVIMPGMNGRGLAEQLLVSQKGMRCLFMSGYTSDIIANKGVLDTGVYFIQKPFSKNKLATKIREVLEEGAGIMTAKRD
jgi:two-component system, cell cycle sensor histidine kinase and response regulator CckA